MTDCCATCADAALNVHLICLKRLHCSPTYDKCICIVAAKHGHLEMLKWARSVGYPWDPNTTSAAAAGGHLDCLRYAVEEGCPWHPEITLIAAFNGHLDCLRYAVEEGRPWHPSTTWGAAQNGHLDCLRYAVEEGRPWHPETTWAAAQHGHLNCLRFAVEEGRPWHPETTWGAAFNGHLDCLRFAVMGAVQPRGFIDRITVGDKRCLDWLAAAHAAATAFKAAWKASRQRRVVTFALCMGRLLPGGVAARVVGRLHHVLVTPGRLSCRRLELAAAAGP